MRLLAIACVTIFAVSCSANRSGIDTIAVVDLEGAGVSSDEARTLTEKLRVELHRTGLFKVIERGQMNEILKEQGFQRTGCTSQECAVEIGQIIGVKKIIAGTVGRVGNTYSISIRLVDVATGEILKITDQQVVGKIDNVLTDGVSSVARKMASSETGGVTSQPPARLYEGTMKDDGQKPDGLYA